MSRFLTAGLSLAAAVAAAAAPGQAPEWMQTARVFLIDAYEPPFATRLEFDAQALVETMARMNANTVRIATMGKHALIQGTRFTPHPELGQRDVLAETIAAAKPRGIRVVPYISTGHKLAWSMVTRDHPEYAQRTRPGGPPARSKMFVGEDHGTVCWNTPYRQAFFELIEHVVRDYDIDGIYFDRWVPDYFWPGRRVCYCDGCRTGFRQHTGLELPWREKDSDYTAADAAAINKYHAWIQDNLIVTIRQTRKIVKSHKDIPLIYNVNDPVRMTLDDPRISEAMDASLYERGNSILERAEGVSLASAAGLGVWPYVGEYNNWPRTIHNGFDFQQQIFTTVMFGGAPILAIPWGYVQHKAARRYVEYPFGVIKANENAFAGFANYPYAAVVYGYRTPAGHAQSGWWWRHDVRLASLGAFAALLYGHVQVCSVGERILDDLSMLARYKVLYLADFPQLTAARIANVTKFVEQGGGLVATYATSLFDTLGDTRPRPGEVKPPEQAAAKQRQRFGLENLLRVEPLTPSGELADVLANYRSMTGGPYDLYLADRERPSLDTLTPLWHFQPVQVIDGGQVWKNIVTGDGMRTILPGVVISTSGKGKVVYCASGLESLYLQQNNAAAGDFIRSLVSKAASIREPYEIEAPAALIANLTRKGNTMILHLTNWTGNKLERPGANEYYLAPVENVRIRIRVPEGKSVRSVGVLVPSKIRRRQSGSALEVTLPLVEAYQGIRIELAESPQYGPTQRRQVKKYLVEISPPSWP
jgi:hypothetical protein